MICDSRSPWNAATVCHRHRRQRRHPSAAVLSLFHRYQSVASLENPCSELPRPLLPPLHKPDTMSRNVHRSGGLDSNHHNHPNADDEFTLANMVDTKRPSGGSKPNAPPPANDDIVDITAPQKMISAMSGSLLTSLLGTSMLRFWDLDCDVLTFSSSSHSPRRRPCPPPVPNRRPPTDRRFFQARPHHDLSHPRPNRRARRHLMLPRGLLCWRQCRVLPRRAPDRRHISRASARRMRRRGGAAPHL